MISVGGIQISQKPQESVLRFIKLKSLFFTEEETFKILLYLKDIVVIKANKEQNQKIFKEMKVTLFFYFYLKNIVKMSLAARECLSLTLKRCIEIYNLTDTSVPVSALLRQTPNFQIDKKLMHHTTSLRFRCLDCKVRYLCQSCSINHHKNHQIEILDQGIFQCDQEAPKKGDSVQLVVYPKRIKRGINEGKDEEAENEYKRNSARSEGNEWYHRFSQIPHDNLNLKKRSIALMKDSELNFSVTDPILKTEEIDLEVNESIVSNISLKILSGGLDDDIHFGLAGGLKTEIKGSQIPGVDSRSFGYSCCSGLLRVNWQRYKVIQLPRTGSGDILTFWVSTHGKVYFFINSFLIHVISDSFESKSLHCWVSLKGTYSEVQIVEESLGLKDEKFKKMEISQFQKLFKDKIRPIPEQILSNNQEMVLEMLKGCMGLIEKDFLDELMSDFGYKEPNKKDDLKIKESEISNQNKVDTKKDSKQKANNFERGEEVLEEGKTKIDDKRTINIKRSKIEVNHREIYPNTRQETERGLLATDRMETDADQIQNLQRNENNIENGRRGEEMIGGVVGLQNSSIKKLRENSRIKQKWPLNKIGDPNIELRPPNTRRYICCCIPIKQKHQKAK